MELTEKEIQQELAALLSKEKSNELLYVALAESAGLGADEIDKPGEGKALFSRLWNRHGDAVCRSHVVQAYLRDPTTADATMIGAQIVNILIAIEGVNVLIVAALALRIGLRSLCPVVPETAPEMPKKE